MSFVDEKTASSSASLGHPQDRRCRINVFRSTFPMAATLFAVNFGMKNRVRNRIDGSSSRRVMAAGRGGRKTAARRTISSVQSNGRIAVAVGLRGTVVAKKGGGDWAAVDTKTLNWLSIFLERTGTGTPSVRTGRFFAWRTFWTRAGETKWTRRPLRSS
jgi:hypothetical protein